MMVAIAATYTKVRLRGMRSESRKIRIRWVRPVTRSRPVNRDRLRFRKQKLHSCTLYFRTPASARASVTALFFSRLIIFDCCQKYRPLLLNSSYSVYRHFRQTFHRGHQFNSTIIAKLLQISRERTPMLAYGEFCYFRNIADIEAI